MSQNNTMNSHSSHCKRQFWGNPLAAQCPGVRHRVVMGSALLLRAVQVPSLGGKLRSLEPVMFMIILDIGQLESPSPGKNYIQCLPKPVYFSVPQYYQIKAGRVRFIT